MESQLQRNRKNLKGDVARQAGIEIPARSPSTPSAPPASIPAGPSTTAKEGPKGVAGTKSTPADSKVDSDSDPDAIQQVPDAQDVPDSDAAPPVQSPPVDGSFLATAAIGAGAMGVAQATVEKHIRDAGKGV